MMNQLAQAVILGGYYALIACGLSFMLSIMRIINLAHGSFLVAGSYLIWALCEYNGLSPFVALLILLPIMALCGWALQRFLLERSARGGELLPILTTFGLAIVIDNLLFQQFGADTRSLAPYIGDLAWDSFDLGGGIYVGKVGVIILVTAIVLLAGLQTFLSKTATGKAIRATAEDPDTAGIVGIDARRASAIAAAIALGTVSFASMALGMRATFNAYAGGPQLLFAFETIIIGGPGSLWGTLVGGMVPALSQTLGASVHPQGFLIGGHLAFIIVLFARLLFSPGDFRHRLRRSLGMAK
jgi:branched-chain amino acid transport system permease protein